MKSLISKFAKKLLCIMAFVIKILGSGAKRLSTAAAMATFLFAVATNSTLAQTTLRVDRLNGSPTGDGSGWGSNAYKFLSNAIDDASNLTPPVHIWVAAGTYKPDESATTPNGTNPPDRNKTFSLHSAVAIYGGFAGDEPPPNEGGLNMRDYRVNICILDGDIGTASDTSDNSYHVVTGKYVNEFAVIDGFTVRHGNAVGWTNPDTVPCDTVNNPPFPNGVGGGLYLQGCTPGGDHPAEASILRITFEYNLATRGGAVCLAGVELHQPIFQSCVFRYNEATEFGGAFYIWCLTNQSQEEPFDDVQPGGQPNLINCLLHSNHSDGAGGALRSDRGSGFTIRNCTIVTNTAEDYGALSIGGCFGDIAGGGSSIRNSILWDNGADPIQNPNNCTLGHVSITYSSIQGGFTGTGNTNQEPDFQNASAHNYRLACPSTDVINSAEPSPNEDWATTDTFDLNQNGNFGTATVDLDTWAGSGTAKNSWRFISRMDMGCYETQPVFTIHGDITPVPCRNSCVNVNDLLAVINGWGTCSQFVPCYADITGTGTGTPPPDGVVNVNDLLMVINNWGGSGCTGTSSLTSVNDCFDFATYELELEPYSEEWDEVVNDCIDALCKADIIICD